MQGPEGIPEREHGIAVKSLRLVDLPVHTPVLSVDITEQIGSYGRMIHRCIEGPQPLAALSAPAHVYLGKVGFPEVLRGGQQRVKVETALRHVGQKVEPGII